MKKKRICVAGCKSSGKTSLIRRLITNEFSLREKPTRFVEIYHTPLFEIFEIPFSEHAKPFICDFLILICSTQHDVVNIARDWFGFHRQLFVAIHQTNRTFEHECPLLCPSEHIVYVNVMSGEGVQRLLHLILKYI